MARYVRSIAATLRRSERKSAQRWAGIAAMTALALGLVVDFAPTASAQDMDFQVWNISGGPITLSSYDANPMYPMPANPPSVGTVIPVGQSIIFHLNLGKNLNPRFTGRGGAQNWLTTMVIDTRGSKQMICRPNPGTPGVCSPLIGNNVVALWDQAPGPTIPVPASDAQKQADVFNNLCNNPAAGGLQISCDYTNMTKSLGNTPWRLPDKYTVVTNQQDVKSKTTMTVSSTTSRKTTVTLTAEASVKFFSIVNSSLKAQSQEETTESQTFTQSTELTVPPHRSAYICMSNPLNHYVGTLRVRAANTTFNIENVAVDTPMVNGHSRLETWDVPNPLPDDPDPCEGFVRGAITGANQSS